MKKRRMPRRFVFEGRSPRAGPSLLQGRAGRAQCPMGTPVGLIQPIW